MWVGVVRPRRGLGVTLHGENRKCFVPKTFLRSVVEIEGGDLQIRGAGHAFGGSLHRKSVILRSDEDSSARQFAHRVVPAPVTVRELDGPPPEGEPEELVAE